MSRVAPLEPGSHPLSAAKVAAGGLRLGVVALDGDDVYWLEGRPREGGRYATLVRRTPDGRTETEVTPPDINVRSRVHEYGGDAYAVHTVSSIVRTSPISVSIVSVPRLPSR